jgi:catalase
MAKKKGFETQVGEGGETHQRIPKSGPHSVESHLTTNQGIRVSDNQNPLYSGARGPSLLKDFVLREKIFHFDHERIPERIVHARGSAAHGFFETYESLSDITSADLFQRKGQKTPLYRLAQKRQRFSNREVAKGRRISPWVSIRFCPKWQIAL